MTKAMGRSRLLPTITAISTIEVVDAPVRAHTARVPALVTDLDRIDAARLAAERLCDWLMVWGAWNVYVDSVGAVVSEQP